jgi:nicotinate-nucleotide adenylyltransferase
MREDICEKLLADIRARLSDFRYVHSLDVADCAKALAERYGADPEKAYIAGLAHDVLKEQKKKDALQYFALQGVSLTPVEASAPKLWHAMAAELYLRQTYGLPEDILSAVRYHTTGRAGMTLLEKVLFTADFISADRDYPGVEDMRERAKVSLELAMEEGLRFTIEELARENRPIHPDTVAAYNEIVTEKGKNI